MAIEDQILKGMFPASPGMLEKAAPPESDASLREAYPASPGMFEGEQPPKEAPASAPPTTSAPAAPTPTSPPPVADAFASFRAAVADWGSQARSDPEIGGPNWDRTLADALSVIRTHGDAELRQALNVSGVGNHRAMIRFLAKIARAGR